MANPWDGMTPSYSPYPSTGSFDEYRTNGVKRFNPNSNNPVEYYKNEYQATNNLNRLRAFNGDRPIDPIEQFGRGYPGMDYSDRIKIATWNAKERASKNADRMDLYRQRAYSRVDPRKFTEAGERGVRGWKYNLGAAELKNYRYRMAIQQARETMNQKSPVQNLLSRASQRGISPIVDESWIDRSSSQMPRSAGQMRSGGIPRGAGAIDQFENAGGGPSPEDNPWDWR